MTKIMRRTRFLVTSIVMMLLGAAVSVQSPAATLAPTGTLRAVFLGGNPVQGRVDPKTGAVSGTVPDLAKELARRLASTAGDRVSPQRGRCD